MPAIIAQADVCVAPLAYNDRNVTQGCCPIKVIEYMACARPIVAANLPVVRELVRDDVDALLFTPDDPAELGALRAGDSERRDRWRSGWPTRRRSARKTSSVGGEAQKKLVRVYEKLLDEGRPTNDP